MTPRRIVLFSGSRAELALQIPVWRALEADPRLEPLMLIGGAHTQEPAAHPDDLREAAIPVAGRVFELPNVGHAGTPHAIGTGILSAAETLSDLRPDFVVVYGDRFESYAACIAATQMHIPVAHIEGGDYTAGGCLDDSVRHAMTKLAHLHFTTNEQASERIRRMGEEDWRVHTVGLPSLDLAAAGDYASEAELVAEFGLDLSRPVVLFCMHPVPATNPQFQTMPALGALQWLIKDGMQVIALHPNNDEGRTALMAMLEWFKLDCPEAQTRANLGRRRFHGMLHLMGCRSGYTRGVLIGNSSAGIKEAPWFGCPVVNVGDRQRGRLQAGNVRDVPSDRQAIYNAALDALTATPLPADSHTYGNGTAGPRIADALATVEMGAKLVQKRMTY